MVSVLQPVATEVDAFDPTMLVGTSGTFGDLAKMTAARETGAVPISVNQLHVTREALESLHEDLVAQTASERRKIAGLEARRAELVPAGSLLALVAMELFEFDEMVVGEWALREGMVLDALGAAGDGDAAGDPRVMRAASVLDLCRRCGWREDHSRQVARLALRLFDETAVLHGLSDDHRELLEHAALLHDIGEHVSGEGHHKHTAYLIQHGRLRGFAPHEVLILATLGRYHRQGEPKSSFGPYANIGSDEKPAVRFLTALLQVADGLDRAHAGAVEAIDVSIDEERVEIRVHATTDADLELWGARRKRSLFEDVTGRRLDVEIDESPPNWQERRGA